MAALRRKGSHQRESLAKAIMDPHFVEPSQAFCSSCVSRMC